VYLGLSPRLLGGAAEAAVLMGVYQAAMAALSAPRADASTSVGPQSSQDSGSGGGGAGERGWLRLAQEPVPEAAAAPIAGGIAGAAVSLVLGPSELIKARPCARSQLCPCFRAPGRSGSDEIAAVGRA
jgi:hypothetical protein